MAGLIYHEPGHLYRNQFGIPARETADGRKKFLRQLFTEVIAMLFERKPIGNPAAFHQDCDEWLM